MSDFNKVFKLKIVSLIISISFLFMPSSYPYSSKNSLRVPMGQESTNNRVTEAMSAEAKRGPNESLGVKNNNLRPGEIGIYKDGRLVNKYSRHSGIPKDVFEQLDRVVIKGMQLNSIGKLSIGSRIWTGFRNHPNLPIEIYIERGNGQALVTKGRILNEKGKSIEEFQMCRYESLTGELLDVFYQSISKDTLDELSKLGSGIIKGRRLNKRGFLVIGNRLWAMFPNHSSLPPIEIYIERGNGQALVTKGRILNEKGESIEEFQMGRYESPTGELLDVFHKQIYKDTLDEFSKLGKTVAKSSLSGINSIRDTILDPNNKNGVWEEISSTEVRLKPNTYLKKETIREIAEGDFDKVWAILQQSLGSGIIKGRRLDEGGCLSIGNRTWVTFLNHSSLPIEIYIERGKGQALVTKGRILNEEWKTIEEFQMCRYESLTGELLDVFYQSISKDTLDELSKLGNGIIKGRRLDENGCLSIGNRTWVTFSNHPNLPIEIYIERGKGQALVTKGRILNEKGESIEEFQMGRYESLTGELLDVFYERIFKDTLDEFSKLGSGIIKGRRLNENGRLFIGGRVWSYFRDYPKAIIEIDVEKDKGIVLARLIKDRHGKPIQHQRTGDRFGKTKRNLFLKEEAFLKGLADELHTAGLPSIKAKTISETLVRLKNSSLELLDERGGLLTKEDVEAIKKLELSGMKIDALAKKLKAQITKYGENNLSESNIELLLKTHLLPWTIIEQFQRTYRLGKDMSLILDALKHPDVEAWVRRVRETQSERGTLNKEKHLTRYDPAKEKLLAGDEERNELRAYLRHHMAVLGGLKVLVENRPVARFEYRLLMKRNNGASLRISGNKKFDIQIRQKLRIAGKNLGVEVQGINEEDRIITVNGSNGSLGSLPEIGVLEKTESTFNIDLQIEEFEKALSSFSINGSTTTGSKILDRLFRLKTLTEGELPQVEFSDKRIPYRKIREFESEGDEAQEIAVKLAIDKSEVLFIEGPPGTGKTAVIAEILRQAVSRGKKVLLVSQMHQAVDNALADEQGEKPSIMDDPTIPVLRLGNNEENFLYGTKKIWAEDSNAVEEFEKRLKHSKGGFVIAGTNIGVATRRHKLNKDQFDIVIMYEASRSTLGEALVPLSFLKPDGKAIFVGDTRQLPPFGLTHKEIEGLREIKEPASVSKEDIEAYQKSVLEILLEKEGGNDFERGQGERVLLSTNYRSHPLIAGLVSYLSYEGAIHRKGWEDFDIETLSLRVTDVASDTEPELEKKQEGRIFNPVSAEKVLQLIFHYKKRGIALKEITVITPYKAQVDLIISRINELFPNTDAKELPQVTTIDGYQGGENETIIFDFVRSNKEKTIGFLKDIRRLNVGLSRAKNNLALIWDSRTIIESPSGVESEEDHIAREFFNRLQDYYEKEVQTFFPEPEELELEPLATHLSREETDRPSEPLASNQSLTVKDINVPSIKIQKETRRGI